MTDSIYKCCDDDLVMAPDERSKVQLLVIEPDPDDRQALRGALESLGFGAVNCQADHVTAINIFQERPFTHLVFSTRTTNMPAREFLLKALTMDPQVIALPTSFDPQIDDVFDLLRMGARGYVIKPFSTHGLEQAILMATEGEAFSDAILNARDRNQAFSALAAATLDKLATAQRHSQKYVTAQYDLPKSFINFRSAVKLGRTFAKGGEEELLESMVDFFVKLADGPASRLGRLRRKLKTTRASDDGVEVMNPVQEFNKDQDS